MSQALVVGSGPNGLAAAIRLAVLVDRGPRELPIRADAVGMTVETGPGERVLVRVRPVDGAEEIVRVVGRKAL